MTFNSLNEMVEYIEKKLVDINKDVGEDIVQIAKIETDREQKKYSPVSYKRTGNLIECIKTTKVDKDEVEVTWTDTGTWTSNDGKSVYAPKSLEEGTTYGSSRRKNSVKRDGKYYRPQTHFVENTERKVESKIGTLYKKRFKDNGIPVK